MMALVICPDCGKEQDNANRFCKNCGADLSDVEAIPEEEEIINDADESVEVSQEIIADPIEEKAEDSALNKCPNCGTELKYHGKFCPNCGTSLESISSVPQTNAETKVTRNQTVATTKKNPFVAAILSFIFPGIGQLYIGQNNKGGYFIVIAAVSIVLMVLFIGFIFYALFWLWSILDAYSSAQKLNKGELVEDTLF